jgi:two-component system NtrC family sensor kinase
MGQARSATPAASEATSRATHARTLRWRLTPLLIGASVLPLAVVGLGGWVVFRGLLADRVEEHLRTIVLDHAHTVDLFLAERLKALRLITESYGEMQLKDPAILRRVFEVLNSTYEQSFQDLGLIDDQGQHISYIGPYRLLGQNYSRAEWFHHVRDQGRYISDVFLGVRKVPHFIMAVRHNQGGGRFWVLRASINSEVFDRLVARVTVGSNGDCYLLDKAGRYQTRPRGGGEVLSTSTVLSDTPPDAGRTVRTRTGEGREILRTVQWIKDGQWLLVAERSVAEVEGPFRQAFARGATVFGVGVLAILVVTVFTTNLLFRMLARAEQQTEVLDAQLLRAAELASVGEMATGVAHEINNPLGIIYSEQTNIDDLLRELDPNDPRVKEMRQSVAQTTKQIKRCKTITHKLLQFGRQGVASGALLEVGPELAEIVRLFEKQASVNNISLVLEVEPGLSRILIDAGELQQVFTNLVNNAFQALHGRSGVVLISAWSEKGKVMVAVEDTGPGIPPSERDKVFEPFYTTKKMGEGTGLGLSVCYGIVVKWNGRVYVDPESDGGARFLVEFPAAAAGVKA